MKQAELETLITAGAVSNVVVSRVSGGDWTVFAYGEDFRSLTKGSDAVETARSNKPREWASLDNLINWLRDLGWKNSVTVEG